MKSVSVASVVPVAGGVEGACRREPVGRELWRQPPSSPFCSPVAGDHLSEKETEDLMAWMRNALGSRVTNVKVRPPKDGPPPSHYDPW